MTLHNLEKLNIQLQLKEIHPRVNKQQVDFEQEVKEMGHVNGLKEIEMRTLLGLYVSSSWNSIFLRI